MITLTGTLRQSGKLTFDGKDRLKIWIEHETPRDNGVSDLRIEELFLPMEEQAKLPAQGQPVSVIVRPYAVGRDVKFSASALALNTGKKQ